MAGPQRGATRGSGVGRRGDRPLVGWLPVGKAAVTYAGGSDGGDDAVRMIEGLGHPFEKRMILPLRI
ncbi:hypothetical protein B296_00015468 [Ensete ventricosum]|uniref:Uncharacterized protein n=1 Tax=Ensete ventricosum TaxID=4639 RepID=A0A426XD87_ENSVE|nr:hypothetical protein B296_00015468 [Ensete ventricosum]